jgi:hypothetical protein
MERVAAFINSYDYTSFKRQDAPVLPSAYPNTQCGYSHFSTATSQVCKTAIIPASTHRNFGLHWILPRIAFPC